MDVVVAIKRGDVNSVKQLINETPTLVNCTEDSFGQTLLHLACQAITNNNKEILTCLLTNGADPSLQDDSGNTPLHACAESGDLGEFAALLLTHGASANVPNQSRQYPLHIACRGLNFPLAEVLLKHGAQPNVQAKRVVSTVDMNEFSLRLKSLMPLNKQDLSKDIGLRTEELGPTPLHYAATATKCVHTNKNLVEERWKIIKLLLESGADTNIVDNSTSMTSLLSLVSNCEDDEFANEDLIRKFVDVGTKLEVADEDGDTALMHAATRNKINAVRQLVKCGAHVNELNPKGKTALHCASGHGNGEIVQFLLENEADAEKVDSFGSTPLHEAASFGHTEVVRKLVLLGGSDVTSKIQAYPQSTPLHLASQNGNLEMVDFLLQQGAHLLETDAEGDTAEKVAANQEVADFLSGHVQVCFLQEKIIALPALDTLSADIEKTAKRFYGNGINVKFDSETALPGKEVLVNVSLPKQRIILKVKRPGENFYYQIFLTKPTTKELKEKIAKKFGVELAEISRIVLLPDIVIVDDDDVGTLSGGDELEVYLGNKG